MHTRGRRILPGLNNTCGSRGDDAGSRQVDTSVWTNDFPKPEHECWTKSDHVLVVVGGGCDDDHGR